MNPAYRAFDLDADKRREHQQRQENHEQTGRHPSHLRGGMREMPKIIMMATAPALPDAVR